MSKKELLERLTRAPSDPVRTQRREDEGARSGTADAVTTRVSRKVVRRRRARGSDPDAPRRAAADEQAPAPVKAEAAAETPSPEPEAEAAEAAPTPEAAAPEVAASDSAPQAEAEVEAAAPPAEAGPETAPAAEAGADEPATPVAAAADGAPAAEGDDGSLPDQPRYPELGIAVVMPPPGWDPTNPLAYRRDQKEEAAPATPAKAKPQRGRRRVETGSQTDFRARRPSGRRGGRGFNRPVRNKRRRSSGPKAPSPAPAAHKRVVKVDNVISVGQLAHELGVKAPVVIRVLMDLGQMAAITEMLDVDTATLVAAEFEYGVENVGFQEETYLQNVVEGEEEGNLQGRPPVVTIMGHVDHGKTTLLDALRNARVAQGEAGGITQHIGAYQAEHGDSLITFIDTPGHEAFTAMRAHGANVTDIVVLVVAADDGVQPQTEEAIAHARAAEVPIIVAINKMDKPGMKADPVKQRLADHGLVPEDWGGETQCVPVSALKGEGLDDLLEAITLQSEMLDLQANPDRHAEGQVIEAKMERGRGAVATVLVQKGTLNRGDYVVLGSAYGKVRALVDHRGGQIKAAGPSTPVELFGLSGLPEVGDAVNVVKTERNARKLADHRGLAKRQATMAQTRRRTAEDLFAAANAEEQELMHLILKADVQGTLQALTSALDAIDVEGAEVRTLHAAVGDISESDVNLAAANGAILIGFNVNVDAKARQAALQQGVETELYRVIYDVIDRVVAQLKGLLAPVFELVRQGSAEVRVLFKISKVGTVAGSYVLDGKIGRGNRAKVLRDDKVVWEGKIHAVKRFKDDVREVAAGYECGISLDGFDGLQEGDVIESYSEQQVERT